MLWCSDQLMIIASTAPVPRPVFAALDAPDDELLDSCDMVLLLSHVGFKKFFFELVQLGFDTPSGGHDVVEEFCNEIDGCSFELNELQWTVIAEHELSFAELTELETDDVEITDGDYAVTFSVIAKCR